MTFQMILVLSTTTAILEVGQTDHSEMYGLQCSRLPSIHPPAPILNTSEDIKEICSSPFLNAAKDFIPLKLGSHSSPIALWFYKIEVINHMEDLVLLCQNKHETYRNTWNYSNFSDEVGDLIARAGDTAFNQSNAP